MTIAIASAHPAVLPAIIAAAGAIIGSLIAAFVAWQSRAIRVTVNGRLDQALAAVTRLEDELRSARAVADEHDIPEVRAELGRRHTDRHPDHRKN